MLLLSSVSGFPTLINLKQRTEVRLWKINYLDVQSLAEKDVLRAVTQLGGIHHSLMIENLSFGVKKKLAVREAPGNLLSLGLSFLIQETRIIPPLRAAGKNQD